MKKIIFALILMLIAGMTSAQILVMPIKAGAVGVDSVSGNTDTYFYLNGTTGTTNSIAGANRVKATNPITQYTIYGIQIGKTHSAVSGSGDSTRFTVEVSLDNTNWLQWQITPSVISGGMIDYSSYYFGVLTNGYSLYIPTTGTGSWPYMRVKVDNDATGACYPRIYALLKKL